MGNGKKERMGGGRREKGERREEISKNNIEGLSSGVRCWVNLGFLTHHLYGLQVTHLLVPVFNETHNYSIHSS